jgi:putative lipoic acid-binding regulatory protein
MEDMFGRLRAQLELLEWPNVYLFKFIVPNNPDKIALTNSLFDDTAEIVMHPSSEGKYISISAKELMLDVDSIIAKYEKASLIEGIISL